VLTSRNQGNRMDNLIVH